MSGLYIVDVKNENRWFRKFRPNFKLLWSFIKAEKLLWIFFYLIHRYLILTWDLNESLARNWNTESDEYLATANKSRGGGGVDVLAYPLLIIYFNSFAEQCSDYPILIMSRRTLF